MSVLPQATPRSEPTADDIPVDPDAGARGVWLRRAFLLVVALVVLCGAAGLLGVRSRTVTARGSAGDVSLSVHYAQVARAGLQVPFEITVHQREPYTDDVVLVVSRSYLDLFDRSTIDPTPVSATGNERELVWHFDPPAGRTLVVSVDMQVQGGRHSGGSGYVVLRDGGRDLARATFTTHLAP